MNPTVVSYRGQQLITAYFKQLDKHLNDLKEGKTDQALEIRDFAALLHIHPTHLSNTVKELTGKTACYFYEQRLVTIAQELLQEPQLSIGDIAIRLTYDPSNFTKFFKHFTGITPRQYRQQLAGI